MPRRIWMLDLAREQSPSLDTLYQYASTALDSGYEALGLYLEHRFAFPSAPWAHGRGAVTPDMIRSLRSEFPSLQIVPFINLLGHVEGFIYTEEGRRFRAEPYRGLQASASIPEFVELAKSLLDDTLQAFDSELIHIGGDETAQLDKHPLDQARLENYRGDGKAMIYGEHFGPLAQRVVDAGRIPAVWGDIFLEHPDALAAMPKSTQIFDWQYFGGLQNSAPKLKEAGFTVWGCPTLHVYNAAWMHLVESENNIRQVAKDVADLNLEGVCLTTWEFGLFSAVDSILPAVKAAGQIMDNPDGGHGLLDGYDAETGSRRWAELMGVELTKLGGMFAFSEWRSSLKSRLLLQRNPFLAWMHHGEELLSEQGEQALKICAEALSFASTEAEKGITLFIRDAVEFIRLAEQAHLLYAMGRADESISQLAPARYVFETLELVANRTHTRIGGSLADVERARVAKLHVEEVIRRIKAYGHGELGYLPAFDVLTNPRFMPHDQGCWWLVNNSSNQ